MNRLTRLTIRRSLSTFAALSLGLAVAGMSGAAVARAGGINDFCSVTGSYVWVAGNDRCAGPGYHTLHQTQFITKNGSGVYHCAGAKELSGGGGGNAFAFGCTTGQNAYSGCYISSSDPQYPTGLNESSSPHYFRGRAAWGTISSTNGLPYCF